MAIKHLEKEGIIKPILVHNAQLIYTRATKAEDEIEAVEPEVAAE
jgi:hypothetical protein